MKTELKYLSFVANLFVFICFSFSTSVKAAEVKSAGMVKKLAPIVVSDNTSMKQTMFIRCTGYYHGDDENESFKTIHVTLNSRKLGEEQFRVYLIFKGQMYEQENITILARKREHFIYRFKDLNFSYADLSQADKKLIVYVTTEKAKGSEKVQQANQ